MQIRDRNTITISYCEMRERFVAETILYPDQEIAASGKTRGIALDNLEELIQIELKRQGQSKRIKWND
jgi:hypothetical protein